MMRFKVPVHGGEVEAHSSWGRDPGTLVDGPSVFVEAPAKFMSYSPVEARAIAAALVACANEAEREDRKRKRRAR